MRRLWAFGLCAALGLQPSLAVAQTAGQATNTELEYVATLAAYIPLYLIAIGFLAAGIRHGRTFRRAVHGIMGVSLGLAGLGAAIYHFDHQALWGASFLPLAVMGGLIVVRAFGRAPNRISPNVKALDPKRLAAVKAAQHASEAPPQTNEP